MSDSIYFECIAEIVNNLILRFFMMRPLPIYMIIYRRVGKGF